jgi:hypothetical protein
MKGILDYFIVSMVLAFVRESGLPARTTLEIAACNHFEAPR